MIATQNVHFQIIEFRTGKSYDICGRKRRKKGQELNPRFSSSQDSRGNRWAYAGCDAGPLLA